MYRSVYDLKSFYNSKVGRVVRRVIQRRIRRFWPDVHDLRVMGYGYATPYLRAFLDEAERVFAVMPSGQGAHVWPQAMRDEKNLVCLANEESVPVENGSVDRVLLVHSMEFSERLQPHMAEIWRILKANGRLMIVVPNRTGLWSRAEWSPFGQGTPYTLSQLCFYLQDNGFIYERTDEALFFPPLKYGAVLKAAGVFEFLGRNIFPFVSGVHIVEVSKQVFAKGSAVKDTDKKPSFVSRPVVQGMRTKTE